MLHALITVALVCSPDASAGSPGEPPSIDGPPPLIYPDDSTTSHTIELAGKSLTYDAVAGTMPIFDEATGDVEARLFHVAYFKTNESGVRDPSRPILFLFNGGPGSSSVWLHLGAFGPKRVLMGDAKAHLPGPWGLADNEGCLLDVTDLVFIDPVTTGFSRATEPDGDNEFHGLESDVRSVGEFIRLFVTRHGRWPSPKFIGGESYGTTRAAALSKELQSRHGMFLHGVLLVSSILDFGTVRTNSLSDVPWTLMLPTYACTAWYHGRLDQSAFATVEDVAHASQQWATSDYLLALARGDAISSELAESTARTLESFTGIAADRWLQANLRIGPSRFRKELLRSQHRLVGRLDTRFVGADADAYGDRPSWDPSYAAILGPYTAAMNTYLAEDLAFHSDLPYEILTGRVHPWDYSGFTGRPVETATRLRSAMLQNPDLRVFLASGYYDLATPWAAADWTMDHLGLDAPWRAKIETAYFPAGHMMYIRDADRLALSEKIRIWMQPKGR
ncbi:MAG: hypothetical protein MK101_11360 [Phycisphaerales bacterium]|nr:hypothetical protein [Phycisphaerales bacterium]